MGKKGLSYQLTISIIFGIVFFMSANFAIGQQVSLDPNQLNIEAMELIASGNFQEAFDLLNQALEIEPNNVHALNNKGSALLGLGMQEEAIVWYDKALEVDPNYVYALSNKGLSLHRLEQYSEAIVWYDKALEVDPNYVIAQQNKRLSYNYKMAQYDPEMAQQINELSGDTPTNSMFEWSQLLILIPIGFGYYLVQRFSKKVKRKSQISR